MPADVHVAVAVDTDIDAWLCTSEGRFGFKRVTLALPAGADDDEIPEPVSAMLIAAGCGGFEWEWESERRLLSNGGDLEANYGLDDWFNHLADVLLAAGWATTSRAPASTNSPGSAGSGFPVGSTSGASSSPAR